MVPLRVTEAKRTFHPSLRAKPWCALSHWARTGAPASCLQPDALLFSPQIGYIEGQRERKGVFPVSYVDVMRDNIQHN